MRPPFLFQPQRSRQSRVALVDLDEDLLPRAQAATEAADTAPTPVAPPVQPALPSLLSQAEVARHFGRDVRTIRRWTRGNVLQGLRIGGGVFYREADIIAALNDRMAAAIVRQKEPRKRALEFVDPTTSTHSIEPNENS